jgi:hypothetical protein
MNAAVWFGAAFFFTLAIPGVVFSPVLKKFLGDVWPGVIAMMFFERFFVLQYFCAIIALVHAFTEWLYLGKPLHRLTMIVLASIALVVFAGGLWLQPRMKALHEVRHAYAHAINSAPEERAQAKKSFEALHGLSSTINLLVLLGLGFYVWRVTTPANGPRFVTANKFRS